MKNRKSKDEGLKTGQVIDKITTTALSRRMRLMYLQVGFVGLFVAVSMWYGMNTGTKIAEQYSPLVDAVMEIKLHATTAHLWFEEIISGDQYEDIQSVWDCINLTEWYARSMLDGGQKDENIYIPLDDPMLRQDILEMLEQIKAFREIAKERLAHLERSSIGSDIDQRFDDVFKSFIRQADDVETALQRVMRRDLKRFRSVQLGLLASCLLLSGLVAALLHRFLRRQSIALEKLNASNQQLMASEQQLRASNQQLIASEQQLKASNQQLIAGEQQLRASNQQLMASEQQLRTSNHNLGERVKELQCMYGVTESIRTRKTLEEVFQDVAELIPPGWHYPEITRGKIIFDGKAYVSEPFAETEWKQSRDIIVHGEFRGSIEVYYLNECPELDEGPFMTEERNLINGMAKAISDAIERKQAEDTLQESKNKHLEAQRIANLGHYVLDVKTGNWTNSVELDTIFGINDSYKKDVAGWLNIVHPDHKEAVSNYLQDDVLSQHRKFDKEYKIVDATTGKGKWVHGLGGLKLDEDGNPIEMFGTIQDITERKRVEQNAQDLARIVETSLNEVFIFDAETFKFIHVNKGARANIGYSEKELYEMTPIDFKPEFTMESFIQLVEPLRSGAKGLITLETVHQRKNGSVYNVEIHLQLAEFHDRPAFVAIILDITETKRLQELESRASRLELAGRIAGQVAHDFNNLLGPIMAYPELIHDELPHDNKAHAFLDAIENAGEKITNINQDLLTMGRRGHYNQEVLDLNRIVLQASQEMESQIDTVTVEMELCEDLMKIKGGGAQIHRILTNLLVNAQDAMRDIGQITIKTENYYADDTSIAFGRVPKGEYVKLTISDTGCGIPDDITQKILEPFFTTKVTDKKRGSGLGLSVVDAVMKDHDGYLDLSSIVGSGTSFYLYFPITREGAGEKDSEPLTAAGTEKILVVDDDKIQRQVSTHLLTKLGYEVSAVESGEKAIEFLQKNPQDLIILDMVMPGGIDGTETYRQILQTSPNQKAIILSGFSESERVLEAQKLGAGAFVKKPVTKQVIAGAVRTELDRPVEISRS